jgi:hypothetical protein
MRWPRPQTRREAPRRVFPDPAAPAPLKTTTKPVVTLGASDADLASFVADLSGSTAQATSNVYQIRLTTSGPGGVGSTNLSRYWSDDIQISPSTGAWTTIYPASAAGPPLPTTCAVSAILVPSCGVWWGAYKPPSSGENWTTTFTNLEAQTGEKFSIVYSYHDMSNVGSPGQFPNSYEKTLGASRTLMVSWSSREFSAGTQLKWSDIAAGKYDASVLNPEAARIEAYAKPIFLTFDPEMDGRMARTPSPGTAAQYVAAYRHIHDTFAAAGVRNVIWVWTPTGNGAHDDEFDSLYPGSAYVDWIGYDPYNFASCNGGTWRTFSQIVDPFYQWLESNGYGAKPFMLPEYGTVVNPSDTSAAATWYAGLVAGLKSHPNIKSLTEWDDTTGGCNTQLSAGPGELAAFGAAGRAVAAPG